MEVKVGVQFSARELVVDSAQTPDQVQEAVAAALTGKDRVLVLVDVKGRRVMVPVDKLAYVEIAESEQRRVGFGSL